MSRSYALFLAFFISWHWSAPAPTWAEVRATIAREFPRVPQLSVAALHAWLADPQRVPPLLLDVREREEFEVSHLHGARSIDTAAPIDRVLAGVSRDTPIVTYCSVGYRSSAYAERLLAAGFTHVQDLQGSIFAWANAGLPVYRKSRVILAVHPYDLHWGQLLDRVLWAFPPP